MFSVLIVDHQGKIASTLAEQLFEQGFDSRAAHSGDEALRIVEAFHPHFAFIWIGLPEMNGFELARRFELEPALMHCHLIAIATQDCAEIQEGAKVLGFARVLCAPVQASDLLATINELAASPSEE